MRGPRDEALDVLVVKTLGASARARPRRRPRRAEPGASDPDPLPVTRVTVIGALGFEDEVEASGWLERCRKQEAERDRAVEAALAVLNRALHAHRVAAADPYVREVSHAQARMLRLGYGTGDELVEGHWQAAYVLPRKRLGRHARRQLLVPQEQFAGILSGRRPVWASEDLVLRARLDLQEGRAAQAALQLRAGLQALQSELTHDRQEAATARLRERDARVGELAAASFRGERGSERMDALEEALGETEREIRRRRHRED